MATPGKRQIDGRDGDAAPAPRPVPLSTGALSTGALSTGALRPGSLRPGSLRPGSLASGPLSAGPLRLGAWTLDPGARRLSDGARETRLSPRAARLLCLLAERPGQAMRREALQDAIWPTVTVGDESLTQAVAELRRAFGPDGKRLVETIPKHGYRLNADTAPAQSGMTGTEAFDLDAYLACLEVRAVMTRGGHNVVPICERMAREATERAPRFATARAEHAIMLSYLWLYQRQDDAAAAAALEEAEAAIALAPERSEGHTAKAFALAALGRAEAAAAALNAAMRQDLGDATAHFIGARMMFALGRYRLAAGLAERAGALQPDDPWPLYFAARAASTFDPARARQNASAGLRRVEAILAADVANPRARNLRGPLLAALGRTAEARKAIDAQDHCGSTLQIYDAIGLATIGDTAKALSVIGTLAERGWSHGAWLRAEPAFHALQDNARFRDALSTMTH